MFTDLLISISHRSLTFWFLVCERVLRPPQIRSAFSSPSDSFTSPKLLGSQMSWPDQLLCHPENLEVGCCAGAKSQPDPELPPYSTFGLHLPAGRFGDLSQLPFSQQLKFFEEFSSVSQLNIFKSLSSPTFPEQFCMLTWLYRLKADFIQPGPEHLVRSQAKQSQAESASLESSADQPQRAVTPWPRSWEKILAGLEEASSTFVPLLSRSPSCRL